MDFCLTIQILGATNRKSDIDDAFLRRMPLQIRVSLPSQAERVEIFKKVSNSIDHAHFLFIVAFG